jgi:UDP-2,3-diacylglucosamine pyrophosphatase LpxH
MLGGQAYDVLVVAERALNRLRRLGGLPAWPLVAIAKRRIKKVVQFVSDFEASLANEAVLRGCQGVICGHIHTPDLARRGDLFYANTGDWVENSTALVEYEDGSWRLLRWLNNGTMETILAEPAHLLAKEPTPLTTNTTAKRPINVAF